MEAIEVVRLFTKKAIVSAETKIQDVESKQSMFMSIGRIKKRHRTAETLRSY